MIAHENATEIDTEEDEVVMTALEEIEIGAMTAETAAVHAHQAAATGHGTATRIATDESATMIGTGVGALRHVDQIRHVRLQRQLRTGATG